ncbi:hypothetical protein CPB83DRAFT_261077 [Crepidotus variabilis]|uniref:Uncharacterized protein n=1 Tax=Crepidotus variabilis TaxID=179855 RepID=A0A9P6JR82_9AGAR|nr:hypothetical protein CPB83DRAFT_261077 [Crepidotus variabilis]
MSGVRFLVNFYTTCRPSCNGNQMDQAWLFFESDSSRCPYYPQRIYAVRNSYSVEQLQGHQSVRLFRTSPSIPSFSPTMPSSIRPSGLLPICSVAAFLSKSTRPTKSFMTMTRLNSASTLQRNPSHSFSRPTPLVMGLKTTRLRLPQLLTPSRLPVRILTLAGLDKPLCHAKRKRRTIRSNLWTQHGQ